MTVLNCSVQQTSRGTMYNVQESNGTYCNLTWANGTDNVNLNCSSQVLCNITSLITTDCYKFIVYTLGCVEGIFTANCTENSDDVIRPEGNYNGLSWGAWVGIAIAVVIVLAAIALVIYLVIKNRFPCQARSRNLQPDARNESRNNEESVELNANGNHGQP